MSRAFRCRCFLLVITLLLAAGTRGLEAALPEPVAEVVRHEARGGLVAHVGCRDGRLTAALRASDSFLVHGLATEPDVVERVRRHIRVQGLYGPVSVDYWEGGFLPYADDTVNVLVIEGPAVPSSAEIERVLAPGGVACVRRGDRWDRTVKPRPDEIDEWTHFLHGPDNNAVAEDSLVGPPRRVQWVCGPRWSRSHENDRSVIAMVSAAGRVIYLIDHGPTGFAAKSGVPGKWYLEARDAFSGVRLWQIPADDWPGMGIWGRTQVSRRLVAHEDAVYVTLGGDTPVTEVNCRTGEIHRRLEGTEGAAGLRCLDDVLIVVKPQGGLPKWGADSPRPMDLMAFDVESGRRLWSATVPSLRLTTTAALAERIYYFGEDSVHCLDAHDGTEVWETDPFQLSKRPNPQLVASSDALLLSVGGTMFGLSLKTGEVIWSRPRREVGYKSSSRHLPFVINGLLNGYVDTATGKIVRDLPQPPQHWQSPWHHPRCFPDKATERYILTAKRGIELYPVGEEPFSRNNWVRAICGVGVMPCNGLIYVPPHPCFCYRETKLFGFYALGPGDDDVMEEQHPLVRGLAWPASPSESTGAGAWPTYRRDATRSGTSETAVPAELAQSWQAGLGGSLSAPTLSGGRLYVADADRHAVHCLDAGTGERLWQFTAGGPVDGPPTIHRGLALFGCCDGWLYCLRADDGELVWRFRAAPVERRIMAFDRLESPWPVHGAVLVRDGVAYVSAGRSSFLDGGLYLFGLDPLTGEVLHKARLDGPWPDLTKDRGNAFYMDGALNDILVSGAEGSAEYLYLRQLKFDRRLKEIQVAPNTGVASEGKGVDYKGQPHRKHVPASVGQGDRDVGLHLFATSTLLDGSCFDRTGWMFADTWPGYQHINQAPKSGQLVVFDDSTTFAFQQFTRRMDRSPLCVPGEGNMLLVADDNDNEPILKPEHRCLDKAGPGFTRERPPRWRKTIPVMVRGMVLAGRNLFAAGPPEVMAPDDPLAAFEGRKGARLWVVSGENGRKLREYELDAPPVWDGMAAADGCLYMSLTDGSVLCMGAER